MQVSLNRTCFRWQRKSKKEKTIINIKLVYAVEKMIDLESIKVPNPVNRIRACETQLIVVDLMDEFS